jgi:hypothetical protein
MAHPDKSREGSEQGHAQHGKRSGTENPAASGLEPKRPDERPDKQRGEHAGATGQSQPDEAQREADEVSRGSSDGTPPRGGRSGRQSGGRG